MDILNTAPSFKNKTDALLFQLDPFLKQLSSQCTASYILTLSIVSFKLG